jgi:hypothetical protein
MHDARNAVQPRCREDGLVPARSEFRAKFRSKNQLPNVTKGILGSRGYGVNEPRPVPLAIPRKTNSGQARHLAVEILR